MHKRTLEHIRPTLAMTVAMEPLDERGQLMWQLTIGHPEASARRTGIVDVGTHLRIFRVDSQTNT